MGSLAWKVLGSGAAVLAGAVANQVITRGWKAVSGKDAPNDPTNPDDASWKEAVVFAVLTGVVVQGARIAAQRKAAEYYQRSSGHLPSAIEKKAEKARKKRA